MNVQILEKNFSGVTPKIQETLGSMEGVEELHNVYTKAGVIFLDKKGIANVDKLVESETEFFEFQFTLLPILVCLPLLLLIAALVPVLAVTVMRKK